MEKWRTTAAFVIAFSIATVGAVIGVPVSHADGSSDEENATRLKAGLASAPVRAVPVIGDVADDMMLEGVQRAATAAFGSHFGGIEWSRESRTVTISITPELVTPTNAAAVAAAVPDDVAVSYRTVPNSQADLEELRHLILDTPRQFAPTLKGSPGGGIDVHSGTLVITVMDYDNPDAWRNYIAGKGMANKIEVRGVAVPDHGVSAESRRNDTPRFTGGAYLSLSANMSGGYCTAGFNWRTWTVGEGVGSTASHCSVLDYWNYWRLWGHGFKSDPIADTVLLRSELGYSPTVYVGGVDTTDLRTVKTFNPTFIAGQVVALSGATTGLTLAYVANPNYKLPSDVVCGGGLSGVLMDRHNSAPGDSGGPWLVTDTDTKVIGRGQHYGYDLCVTGGSFFIKLNTISAKLQASLMVAS